MKTLLLATLLMSQCIPLYSSPLIAAIEQVESGGDKTALGDDGLAIGILQIHQGVVDDVNRVFHLKWTHEDMYKPEYARMVFRRYMQIYATPERLGRPVTDEDRARIWVAGPNGWKKDASKPYWRMVQMAMEAMK